MPVTYTNRKGKTYVLCQGKTKTGNPRYYFATEPKGEPVDKIPEGYEIHESVNGIVSLAKIRPPKILAEEVAAVQAAVARHPKAHNYQVDVKGSSIVIYERMGPDAKELLSRLGPLGQTYAGRVGELQERLDRSDRFNPEMRFMLDDAEKRTFYAERWSYKGSIDGWLTLLGQGSEGPIEKLARALIPKLGTDAFFDLW